MGSSGLTATAIVALIAFIGNMFANIWATMVKRGHLVRALQAYINKAHRTLMDSHGKADFERIYEKMDSEPDYTPFVAYDSQSSLTLSEIRSEYSFVDGDVMEAIVDYITSETYLQTICADLRTEYVRSFPLERRKVVVAAFERAANDACDKVKIAKKKVDAIATRDPHEWLLHAVRESGRRPDQSTS